ncbi:amidophosphoribosyltransferase [Candidatus Woesearchaeota archaeon]|nr:amidophosphoribosyltransferase [Candidatus Woesearchaeota archaeon]
MPEEIHEECGVAAASLPEKDTNKGLFYIYKLLLNLQNRGQLSAGVTTYNTSRKQLLHTYRDIGTVNEVFMTSKREKSMSLFKNFAGSKGIGHVRYATFGREEKMYAQPFERHHGRLWKWFSFCFNGNLVNYYSLRKELEEKADYHFILENDTEIIMHYLARELHVDKKPPLKDVLTNLSSKFEGAYNLAFINALGEMAVTRDPLGIRPMAYSIVDGNMVAASESNALVNAGYHDFKSLEPGQMIHVEDGSVKVERYAKSPKKAHCMFEWVYFSNVSSILDGKSVYITRTKLGKELAKLETQKIDEDSIVVPVPDSAKAAGDAYAFDLGMPVKEGLIRNRYVGRTFIEGSSRSDKIQSKYTILKEVLSGKKVFLVDDSIVRGTTTEQLVRLIKEEGGAKEVHVRVSCPPIMGPCFYGIDMSTLSELMAPRFIKEPDETVPEKSSQSIAAHLGADSVIYQNLSGLIRSIGLPKGDMCMACLNRDYPTPLGRELIKVAVDDFRKGKKDTGRLYEKAATHIC